MPSSYFGCSYEDYQQRFSHSLVLVFLLNVNLPDVCTKLISCYF